MGDGPGNADAWILLDPSDEELSAVDGPVAVWWSDPRPPGRLPECVRVVVIPALSGVAPAPGVLPFPVPGVEVQARLHLTPTLRERWRRAAGLPKALTADLWRHTATNVSHEDRALILVASAVAARGDLAAEALATGAPLVTDAATARVLDLRPGQEALVVDGAQRAPALAHLASELRGAAVMSRRARRFAEAHLDQGAAADLVLRALLATEPPPAAPVAFEELAVRELARQVSVLGAPPSDGILGSLAERLTAFHAGAERR